jgi:flavin-dependent dehydrogenase
MLSSALEASEVRSIAIIGGGPAGSMTAERLLQTGVSGNSRNRRLQVTIFEERLGWEKPCGGGLPAKALVRYPFLLEACEPHAVIQEAELVAGSGEAVRFHLRMPIVIYSRSVLNGLLLWRAQSAGAQIVSDHITSFHREGGRWKLQGRNHAHLADFLVLANGARSSLRPRVASRFQPQDFMLTYGYYAPASDSLLRIQFLTDFEGYAWAFPRPDHLSIGICGKLNENDMTTLRERLHGFMQNFGYATEAAPIFSHLLPALNPDSWTKLELTGEGWAIAGDAGGLVDPLTGEGIYFAMRSGELLAESLLAGAPQSYLARIWREFGRRLAMGARLAPRFYHGDFLGRPSTTRLVEFCSRSPAFMNLLQDLLEGTQSYTSLPRRAYQTFAKGAFQMVAGAASRKLSTLNDLIRA